MVKFYLGAPAAALAIVTTSTFAQTAPVEAGPDTKPAAVKAPVVLDEVMITAQRVQESAQNAPIAVTVVRPDELLRLNVTRAEDLSVAVPALVATASGGPNTSFFIRGVGNTTSNSYSDPAISFNFDGVTIGRPNATQGFFFDLERIEVLKGPQGTLYGRNATGGAINVIPRRPELNEESAEIIASYGNYNATQIQGALNHPLGENAAVRLSGTFDKHDGYLSDGTSDQKQRALRAQVLVNLTPDVTTRFDADYSHQGGVGSGSFIYGTYALTPNGTYGFTPTPQLGPKIGVHDPKTEAFVQSIFIPQVGRFSEPVNSYPFQDNSVYGITNETNWRTAAGTLTVQAGYRKSDIDSLSTTSNFRGFFIDEKSHQSTLEARFAGKVSDKLDYLLGAFYFDEKINNASAINQLTVFPFETYKTGTTSKAGFGRLAFHVTDALTLTAGGRYTDDLKRMDGTSNVFVLFCGAPGPQQNSCPNLPLFPLVRTANEVTSYYAARGIPFAPPGVLGPNAATLFGNVLTTDADLSTKKFTYRLAADLKVTPSNLLYTSYETGFHGGGFNFGRGLETYAPETIKAFTVGSKNRFFDNRLQLNVEAFHWNYKDQQVSQFGTDFSTPPAQVFYTSNIGRSTIKGVDVDVDARVTSTTRFNAGVQYLKSAYNSYTVFAPVQGGVPIYNCPYSVTTYQGSPSFSIDCSGKPGLFSPTWSFNVGLEQTAEVGNYTLIGHAGTRYRGDFFAATTYQPYVISKAALESDASLTLEPNAGGWFVTAFVNNIEDHRRITQSNINGTLMTQSALASAPRTFGMRVGAKF